MNLKEAAQSSNKDIAAAAKYIELLSSQTGTPADKWDIEKVFGSRGKLITNKNEINKRFFKHAEETRVIVKRLTKKNIEKLNSLSGGIAEIDDAHTQDRLDKLDSKWRRKLEVVKKHYAKAAKAIEEAAKINKQINELLRKKDNLGEQISDIVRENFWEFQNLSGSRLNLVTKANVVVTHKNQARRIDLQVNLGRFRAEINLEDSWLKVHRFKNNVNVEGYIHPHIEDGGDICWGSAYGVIGEKLPKGEYADVLRILASLLTSYSDSNPFVHLEEFNDEANGRRDD